MIEHIAKESGSEEAGQLTVGLTSRDTILVSIRGLYESGKRQELIRRTACLHT
jgi:hypothetical protein